MKLILALFLALSSVTAFSQQIWQWRGENRHGNYPTHVNLTTWPTNGPEIVWEFEGIGNGYSSPVFTNNAFYVSGEIDTIGYIFKFDLSGKLIWKKNYGPEWTTSFRGARSTPTIADTLLYVTSGFGNLICMSTNSGNIIWTVNSKSDLDGSYTMHGHSESVAIDNDKVFLVAGGNKHNIVALNRFTGKIIYSVPAFNERPGYNSPVIITNNNKKILVTFTAYHLIGIDCSTGQMLWSHEQTNVPVTDRTLGNGDTHSNSILFQNNHIYYVAGDGNCGVKLKIASDNKSVTQIWQNKKFDDFMGGFVLIDNHLYGGTTNLRDFRAVNANSGLFTDSLKIGSGNTIASGNKIIYYNQKGTVFLIEPNNGKLTKLSEFTVNKGTKEHFSHPVIFDTKLYIRHGNCILAYKL